MCHQKEGGRDVGAAWGYIAEREKGNGGRRRGVYASELSRGAYIFLRGRRG